MLSPYEDQGVRLAPSMTAPDEEVPGAVHGPGLSRGVLAVRKGIGGLLAPVLRLPLRPGLVATSKEAFWQSLGAGTF